MKKLIVICLTIMTMLSSSACIFTDNKLDEKNNQEYLEYIEQNGIVAEWLTEEEMISVIMEIKGITEQSARKLLTSCGSQRDTQYYEYYRLSKSYTVQYGTGIRYVTFTHNAYVNLTRSNDYTANYVNAITNVLAWNVLMDQGEYYFETAANELNSWNSNSVRIFWAGNICLESYPALSLGSGVSVSGGTPYIYRLYHAVDSSISCPQW